MQFGCCYVGRLRCELAGVIDVVVSCCYPNLIWVFLLWEMVDNDPRIRYRAVLRGVMYVLGEHDKHCICTLLTCFGVALIHTTKVLANTTYTTAAASLVNPHFQALHAAMENGDENE